MNCKLAVFEVVVSAMKAIWSMTLLSLPPDFGGL